MTSRANGSPAWDVVVVGGGIVGLATAYQLLVAAPTRRVMVLEKEVRVGLHQSTRNSGVLHTGVYYTPGSLKACLCGSGKRMMESFATEHGIPVVRNGKVIVAVEASELGRLAVLAERAEANGVAGTRLVGPDELAEIEPHVQALRALHCPETAVVDFGLVCAALAAEVQTRGGEVHTCAAVTSIEERSDRARVVSVAGDVEGRGVVVCAGLHADRLRPRHDGRSGVQILPFRGSWFGLRPKAAELVRGNVYPVPDPRFPFLGVHFTRRVDGSVWVGPNAVLAGGREAYIPGTLNLRDLGLVARFPGSWRMARRHLRTGAHELYRSYVVRAHVKEMQRYFPVLGPGDLVPGPTGIRAQAVRTDGTLVDDFLIEETARALHVLNAPSPAATSALAIGQVLAARAVGRL